MQLRELAHFEMGGPMEAQYNTQLSAVTAGCSPNEAAPAKTGETAQVLLHQLHSALTDISRALNEALRDDRTNAVIYLRRAESFLQPAAQPETSRTEKPGPRLAAWQRRRVLEHIAVNLAAPLKNRDLAALVDYSEFHFNVAFRNSLGTSPHEFLIRRRIERAQQLMISTDMPLCDIASECGLADQAHLSRLFRKVVGETPAAWRRTRASPPTA
jgi:transcriptional regulator GlxA family with amidase domain